MYNIIWIRCFLIGVLASASFGPIFVLTFNRSAIHGFLKGFATALGACLADGIYFFLGLIGILSILEESKHFMFFLDTIGGVLLILLGIYSLKKSRQNIVSNCEAEGFSILTTMGKSFLLTIINPLVFVFFMVIGIQILPEGIRSLPLQKVFLGSVMVMIGSLSVLSLVALISSFIGSCISKKRLKLIYFISGLVFLGIGIYFLDHLFLIILKLYKPSI